MCFCRDSSDVQVCPHMSSPSFHLHACMVLLFEKSPANSGAGVEVGDTLALRPAVGNDARILAVSAETESIVSSFGRATGKW